MELNNKSVYKLYNSLRWIYDHGWEQEPKVHNELLGLVYVWAYMGFGKDLLPTVLNFEFNNMFYGGDMWQ